jgi:hypothetical protein
MQNAALRQRTAFQCVKAAGTLWRRDALSTKYTLTLRSVNWWYLAPCGRIHVVPHRAMSGAGYR